jgi:predicted DNA-binding WGR domain protein
MDGAAARQRSLFAEEPYRSAAPPRLAGWRRRRSPIRRIVAGSRTRSATAAAAAEVLAAFRARVHLTSVDPRRNRYRYYVLSWQPLLWGGGALIRTYGRVGTRGQTLEVRYPDRASAQPEIERLLRLRLRHGYTVVEVC